MGEGEGEEGAWGCTCVIDHEGGLYAPAGAGPSCSSGCDGGRSRDSCPSLVGRCWAFRSRRRDFDVRLWRPSRTCPLHARVLN